VRGNGSDVKPPGGATGQAGQERGHDAAHGGFGPKHRAKTALLLQLWETYQASKRQESNGRHDGFLGLPQQ
jgi:hypothetical protein